MIGNRLFESTVFQQAIIRAAALLVPYQQRAEWLSEWVSELWYVRREARRAGREGLRFCLGAFQDAFWLRYRSHRISAMSTALESPLGCMLFLAILAAMNLLFAHHLRVLQNVTLTRGRILPHLLALGLSFLLLPATTSLVLGDYSANRLLPSWTARVRPWAFLASKIALLTVGVFCGTLDLAWVGSTKIQPHGFLVGYVLAFRWAFRDQRRRCPICLRRLSHPTPIGRISSTFLEWCGTEFLCLEGHGVLHVARVQMSGSHPQRWLSLDRSWSHLFPPRA